MVKKLNIMRFAIKNLLLQTALALWILKYIYANLLRKYLCCFLWQ